MNALKIFSLHLLACKKAKYIFIFFLVLSWSTLFLLATFEYPGDQYSYIFFSLIFLALLLSGLFSKVSYGYTFLSVMLWLGFWLKATLHLLFKYDYVEPIGQFNGSGDEWDNILLVASCGVIGVLAARYFYNFANKNQSTLIIETPPLPPTFYKKLKLPLWIILISSIIILSVINIYFSFQQIGIVPKTIIWPLNAIFSWLMSTGFAMAIATLLWWEFSLAKANIYIVLLSLFEATFSSISLLSRGLFVFHIIPIFVATFLNRKLTKNLNLKSSALILICALALYAATFPLVNSIRDYHYSGLVQKPSINFEISLFKNSILKLSKFSVDRWIGLEGLMATSAYKQKDRTLFLSVLTEKVEIGKTTQFQNIANSDYRFSDSEKFLFASLPGPISLFYLSGSTLIVISCMFLITYTVLVSELIVHKIFSNAFLTALWASIISTAVAQMGINVPGLLFYFFLCSLGLFAIYLSQKIHFPRKQFH